MQQFRGGLTFKAHRLCVSLNSKLEGNNGVEDLLKCARPSKQSRYHTLLEGRCKATWNREFKFPWREAGPPNHLNDEVDSDH